MKKVIKWIAITIGVLIIGLLIAGLIIHERAPVGKAGPPAEALAQKVIQAINKEAWDTTRYVQWNFAGIHQYLWDKSENQVIIQWDDQKVILNTEDQTGKVWQNEKILTGAPADKLLGQAWSFFCNDSFWLNAPAKIFDQGTERQIVQLEDGEKALLIKYNSGGVTPGDSYLWLLDENARPKAWKMWVKIIPIGGMESSWIEWKTLSTGALVSTVHETAGIRLEITDLIGGNSLEALGMEGDPFKN